jgi:hypothetical protein
MSICPHQENPVDCTCTYTSCPRHGKCCECIAYHRRSGEFPACLFSPKEEKTYDRSLSALLRDRRE